MLSYSSTPEDRRTNSRITRAGRQTAGPPGAAARRHAGVGQPREPAPKIRGGSQAPDVSAGRRATSPASEEPGAAGLTQGSARCQGCPRYLSAFTRAIQSPGAGTVPQDTHAAWSVRRVHSTPSSAPKPAQAATPGCYRSPPKKSRLWGHVRGQVPLQWSRPGGAQRPSSSWASPRERPLGKRLLPVLDTSGRPH